MNYINEMLPNEVSFLSYQLQVQTVLIHHLNLF